MQAIKQIIEPLANDVQAIKSDIVDMKIDIVGIKSEIVEMKSDIVDMKGRLGNVETEIVEVKDRLENVETEVVKTNIRIENDILLGIQAVREGQRGLHDKFVNIEKRTDNIEEDIIVLKVFNVNNVKKAKK